MKGKLTKVIKGTAERPRISVYRSLTNIYVQVINDEKGVTLASAATSSLKGKGKSRGGANITAAKKVGEEIAKKCLSLGIKKVVFDRSGYVYHGRIAALADAARAGGLEF